MTCPESRELLSALLDDALEARERAEVEAHLAGCSECQRELAGLRSTVSLLSRVERAHAPVGFLDKVMTEVHPVPWYRRLGRRLFLPLSVKLPIEAGAMAVIAIVGVYLLQQTPELKDAARFDRPPGVSPQPESPQAPPGPPAKPIPPAPAAKADWDAKLADQKRAQLEKKRDRLAPPQSSEEAQTPSEPRREAEPEIRQSAPAPVPEPPKLEAPAPRSAPAPVPEPPKPEAPAPRSAVSRNLGSRDASQDRVEAEKKTASPRAFAAPSVLSAKQQALAPASVSGVLTVADRQKAERALADLLGRMGAREIARRQEDGATIVDVVVPQSGYEAFKQELATLGSLRLEGAPAELPPQVPVRIRISD